LYVDQTVAEVWYRQAAAQGYAPAQRDLAVCLEQVGVGRPKNLPEAVKFYRQAAEQGDALAQYHFGRCHAEGLDVSKDLVVAAMWYRMAAEQMNPLGQRSLGLCYAKGEGVAKDMINATKWYLRAAEQGDVLAQNYLGSCYRNGDGVFKNEIEAFAYWSLAGVVDESARAQVALLEQSLKPVDLMRAHQRTNELRKELEQKAEERLALMDGN
jgi:hypothetical protein